MLKKLPPLTILVVNDETGVPGSGFVAAADIPKTQMEVFDFDWLEHGAPSVEDFQHAITQLPSRGVASKP